MIYGIVIISPKAYDSNKLTYPVHCINFKPLIIQQLCKMVVSSTAGDSLLSAKPTMEIHLGISMYVYTYAHLDHVAERQHHYRI
jgi:cAMP phosphodiesterase